MGRNESGKTKALTLPLLNLLSCALFRYFAAYLFDSTIGYPRPPNLWRSRGVSLAHNCKFSVTRSFFGREKNPLKTRDGDRRSVFRFGCGRLNILWNDLLLHLQPLQSTSAAPPGLPSSLIIAGMSEIHFAINCPHVAEVYESRSYRGRSGGGEDSRKKSRGVTKWRRKIKMRADTADSRKHSQTEVFFFLTPSKNTYGVTLIPLLSSKQHCNQGSYNLTYIIMVLSARLWWNRTTTHTLDNQLICVYGGEKVHRNRQKVSVGTETSSFQPTLFPDIL